MEVHYSPIFFFFFPLFFTIFWVTTTATDSLPRCVSTSTPSHFRLRPFGSPSTTIVFLPTIIRIDPLPFQRKPDRFWCRRRHVYARRRRSQIISLQPPQEPGRESKQRIFPVEQIEYVPI
ncbi:hypothetical protein ACFX1Q_035497 [Malus domestica]